MTLRELSIQANPKYAEHKRFNIETWCICEMYWYALRNRKDFPYLKVVIILGEDRSVETFGNVSCSYKEFNFTDYFKKTVTERKMVLLDLLHNEILGIYNGLQLDTEFIERIYKMCLDRNLENRWLFKERYFPSKDKKYQGAIECLWEIGDFVATGIIYDMQNTEVVRKELLRVEPFKGDFIYWAKCKWEGDTFYLKSKDNRSWSISVSR